MKQLNSLYDKLRYADKIIGIPLCFLFTLWSRVKKKSNHQPIKYKLIKRILFIHMTEIGSAVLAYPAIKKIQQKFPKAELYFLTLSRNKDIHFVFDQIIPEKNFLTLDIESFKKFFNSLLQLNSFFKNKKMDITFDFELFTRLGSILNFLSRASYKVGFHRFNNEGLYRGDFLTHKINFNYYHHMALNFLAITEAVNSPHSAYPTIKKIINPNTIQLPKILISEELIECIKEKIRNKNQNILQTPYLIAVNPSGGLLPIRAWPKAHYIELCKRINDRNDYSVILIGTSEDWELNDSIYRAVGFKKCINFAGETSSIKELIALFKIAKAIVTNDSGCAHLASITEIRTIVLFGPETPLLYAPLGPFTTALYKKIHCSPCINAFNYRKTPCNGDNKCLKLISVNEAEKILFQNT